MLTEIEKNKPRKPKMSPLAHPNPRSDDDNSSFIEWFIMNDALTQVLGLEHQMLVHS